MIEKLKEREECYSEKMRNTQVNEKKHRESDWEKNKKEKAIAKKNDLEETDWEKEWEEESYVKKNVKEENDWHKK